MKIEHHNRLDDTRLRGMGCDPNWQGIESVGYVHNLNRSKRSVTIDLKSEREELASSSSSSRLTS